MLTFGSLFTGIGGLDLGFERTGMHCVWQVEKDEYCKKVLQKHWPDVTRHGDIRDCGIDRKHTLARVDLLCGGFPCQDISDAGKREGINGTQSGLWKEFYRLICELRPRYVVVENVAALLHRGIDTVLADLAAIRYDAEWQVLSASAFGAPHQRERVFIVAYSNSVRKSRKESPVSFGQRSTFESASRVKWQNHKKMAHTSSSGWKECITSLVASNEGHSTRGVTQTGREGVFKPRMGGNSHGFSGWMDRHHRWPALPGRQQYDWEPPRITTVATPNKSQRLKALGNAVVPQVAQYIGNLIMEAEKTNHETTYETD